MFLVKSCYVLGFFTYAVPVLLLMCSGAFFRRSNEAFTPLMISGASAIIVGLAVLTP